jgi:PilZ domain
MLVERPRAPRHFIYCAPRAPGCRIGVEDSYADPGFALFRFRAEIKNCSWPVGTRVRVKITHKAANFTGTARIVWVRKDTDLGVAFTDVAAKDQLNLEKWVAELRGNEVLAHSESV